MPSQDRESSRRRKLVLTLVAAAAVLGSWARDANATLDESFEDVRVGAIRVLEVATGKWMAEAGHAAITDRFAHGGKQCLHLLGGEDRAVVFVPRGKVARELSFHAERWTKRDPFVFRIDAWIPGANTDGAWREIYDGDRDIRVGRSFLSHVRVAVPANAAKFRFRATSPKGSGVLLDDLEFRDPTKMVLRRVGHATFTAPALHGRKNNPVTQVLCETTGRLDPLVVTECTIEIPEGTQLSDIAKLKMFVTGGADFSDRRPFGREQDPARRLVFRGEHALTAGQTRLWIAIDLSSSADLDRRIAVDCVDVAFAARANIRPEGRASAQRIGIAVRTAGQDSCHTYRIPGLATTKSGTLIAVYDCRWQSSRDLPGPIDVGMSRSTDGGRTWSKMRIILDMGDAETRERWRGDGVGDPAVLVDRVTGRIWVAATWSHGDRSWNGSGPGMTPEETGQLLLVSSDDDGATWSKPFNITEQVKDPAWRFVLPGPGTGITMRDGTLVFAGQYRSSDDSKHGGKPFSTILYSLDRGRTWKIGSGVKVDTTESQVVELKDGRLMINCRDNRRGSRSVYTTRDLGATWDVHPTSRRALPEPTCMASLLRLEHDEHGAVLLFSNPATTSGRYHMTLKISRDEGASWPEALHRRYDDRSGFGYSCLTRIDADHVGVLYEGQRELYFLRFAIDDLLGK